MTLKVACTRETGLKISRMARVLNTGTTIKSNTKATSTTVKRPAWAHSNATGASTTVSSSMVCSTAKASTSLPILARFTKVNLKRISPVELAKCFGQTKANISANSKMG